jgi:hypothetical protein
LCGGATRLLQRGTTRALEGTGTVTARTICRKDPADVQRAFPIAGVVDGWFFRQTEVSQGAYLVEGTDLWGRKVSRLGSDLDELLSLCAADAKHINDEANGAP